MKYIFLLLLLLTSLYGQSTNQSPNAISTDVIITATKPSFTATEYFSLQALDPSLASQEWYAFLTIKAPQKKFWIKFHVYLYTINIRSGQKSEAKVECPGTHNQLHNCYISHKRINTKEENLVVEMVFQEDIILEIKVEVNAVHMIKLGDSVTLRRGDVNFTRLLRIDVAELKEQFDYLLLDFGQVFVVDEYNNAMNFEVSLEEMPPDSFRHDASSLPLWDNKHVVLFAFQELLEVKVITILCGITDDNTYRLTSSLISNSGKVQQIQPNKILYQFVDKDKSYRLDLPSRTSNIYYLMRINIDSFFRFNVTDVRVNGGKQLTQLEVLKLLIGEGSTKSNSQLDVWINSTVSSLQFTFQFLSFSIFSIQLTEFDINLIELKQKVKWNDKLDLNETQFLFIVIDTKTSDEMINFEVEGAFTDKGYSINYRNCVEKEVTQCHQIATGKNQTMKIVGMPIIKPAKDTKADVNYYRFNNLTITKHEISSYLYRSIIVVEVTALTAPVSYQIRWHMVNPVQIIKENDLIQGKLEPNEPRIFSFTVVDASNLAFARVHFIQGSGATVIFGSSSLVNPETIQSRDQVKDIVHEFDGSVTFTELTSRTTYYVYIMSQVKDIFELTLTYGYNLDDELTHPVSFLPLGEHSTNQLVLQPQEILFVEVRTSSACMLTITNTVPLKICDLLQTQPPKTHKDLAKSNYCQTFSTVNHFYAFNFQNTGRFFVGIQNQNTKPASILLETDSTLLKCIPANLGKTKYMKIDKINSTSQIVCVRYEIPEKGDIEILVDIKNPKLQGIALPSVRIGDKWHSVMNTNLMSISGEDLDSYCEQNYEQCFLLIQIQKNQQHRIDQDFIAVTAAYTSQPLALKDGLAHHSSIKLDQQKYFKYPIYSHEKIVATIQNTQSEKNGRTRLFARVITSDQKFMYPKQEEYMNNSTEVIASIFAGYFYPSILTIQQNKIKEKCEKPYKLCYALFTAYSQNAGNFLIQVTQTVSTLTTGNRLQKYIQKDSKSFFNYRSTQENTSLLFFTTSNVKDCLKLDLYAPNSQIAIASGIQEVLINDAQAAWYTITATAKETCYFTIQASSTKKPIRELVLGFANYFALSAGEKKYYITHSSNFHHLKLVASLNQKKLGELQLQAMPVPDDLIGDFLKFVDGDLEVGKKSKLSYVWSDINHLTLRSSDPKFCKDCYLCFQLQSSKDIDGYLTVPSDNKYSLFLSSYISYDILLKDQSFVWLAGFQINQFDVYVAIQAGQMQLIVQNSKDKELWRKNVKFDKVNSSNNIIMLKNYSVERFDHINIKVVALENTDYSIYSMRKSSDSLPDNAQLNFVEVGRPIYLYIYDQSVECFTGVLSDEKNEFIVSRPNTKNFQNITTSLQIDFTIDGKKIKLEKEVMSSVLLLTLDPSLQLNNSNFQICFSLPRKQAFSGTFMYLGSLNYFPENSVMHIKNSITLTFMSEGRGVIEVDECASRSTLSLNSKYKDVKSMNSKINSRRGANNLITFNSNGPVYLHVESSDYVALSWKNYHRNSFNGYGYEIYSPATFRITFDSGPQDVSVKVKPIEQTNSDIKELPHIISVNYHVYVSGQDLDLYNAMNCQKGKYMYWVKRIDSSSEIKEEATIKLNKIADLKGLFKGKEYVLIVVKAQAVMIWPKNNFTQRYRFYYPYQELLLSQFHIDELTEEDEPNQKQSQSSGGFFAFVFIVVAVGVVALLTFIAIRWLRRKYFKNAFVTQFDDQRSEAIENNGTEMSTKAQPSGHYDPPR